MALRYPTPSFLPAFSIVPTFPAVSQLSSASQLLKDSDILGRARNLRSSTPTVRSACVLSFVQKYIRKKLKAWISGPPSPETIAVLKFSFISFHPFFRLGM